MSTAAIILAAGASTRLGRPKQLLLYKGKTLLRHAADEAIAAGCAPVIVVLGANAETIAVTLEDCGVVIAQNASWQDGMGTTIRVGVSTLLEIAPGAEGALLLLCDQPAADRILFQRMAEAQTVIGKNIVACRYGDTIGAPVLFDAQYFRALIRLSDTAGAKSLLTKYYDDVDEIPFPQGAIDIDMEKDLEHLSTFYDL